MDATPVIDLANAAQVALTRMLDTGWVIGRDGQGRKVIAVAVDDWVLDWFTAPVARKVPAAHQGAPGLTIGTSICPNPKVVDGEHPGASVASGTAAPADPRTIEKQQLSWVHRAGDRFSTAMRTCS